MADGAPNPHDYHGAAHWILYGAAAALVALVVSVYFPAIIPARATNVKL